jgi:hypothetical protein
MSQTRNRRPQQRHGPGDVRSGHRGAAGNRICVVSGVGARARAGAGSRDVGLDPVASVGSYRAATAKGGDGIGARI